MINLNDAVALLRAKRKELLDLLEAVDKALTALQVSDVAAPTQREEHPQATIEDTGNAVVATRVRSRRVLSDEHKHALTEGRRKARHSKDAAAGLAREIFDSSPGLAPRSSAESQHPRLVKRPRR
jgi:hypothetical protein